ncbi:hypothetical protein [uncultured Methanobrevibacter sp.]|uniref:hypothetical protein n=1 Tax=uncultured Methanobrevibacter sp. TaxID=253161 RepID=UPI0025CFB699|nr:hypothetical protein [uncultured Methanobrevibacter sp.]
MGNYKSRRKYKSKNDILMLLSLKVIEEDNKFYLADLNETFKKRIYSESFTHIKQGLIKLKQEKKIFINSKESKRIWDSVLYNLQHKKCDWCHKAFLPKNNAEKYCSKRCRNYAKLDQDRDNKRKQRKNPNYNENRIGTIEFGAHRNKNFEEESKIVRRERNRILNSRNNY